MIGFEESDIVHCIQVLNKVYFVLVYTTQMNSTFRARWLANSEVISQVLFTSEQLWKTIWLLSVYCHK